MKSDSDDLWDRIMSKHKEDSFDEEFDEELDEDFWLKKDTPTDLVILDQFSENMVEDEIQKILDLDWFCSWHPDDQHIIMVSEAAIKACLGETEGKIDLVKPGGLPSKIEAIPREVRRVDGDRREFYTA